MPEAPLGRASMSSVGERTEEHGRAKARTRLVTRTCNLCTVCHDGHALREWWTGLMSHAPLEVVSRVRGRQSSTSMRVWARCAKDKRKASVITWLELQTSRLGNRQSGAIYARFPGSAVDTPPPNDESVILMCK